ncbi:MAG: hypothetical protein M3328_10485 [Chloroflexota bacterium]|nr:hypothetical protein [Chloroflexota bacterium]
MHKFMQTVTILSLAVILFSSHMTGVAAAGPNTSCEDLAQQNGGGPFVLVNAQPESVLWTLRGCNFGSGESVSVTAVLKLSDRTVTLGTNHVVADKDGNWTTSFSYGVAGGTCQVANGWTLNVSAMGDKGSSVHFSTTGQAAGSNPCTGNQPMPSGLPSTGGGGTASNHLDLLWMAAAVSLLLATGVGVAVRR